MKTIDSHKVDKKSDYQMKGKVNSSITSKSSPHRENKQNSESKCKNKSALTPSSNFVKFLKKAKNSASYDNGKRAVSIVSIPKKRDCSSVIKQYQTSNNKISSSMIKANQLGYSSVNYLRDRIHKNASSLGKKVNLHYEINYNKSSKEKLSNKDNSDNRIIDSNKAKKMNLLQNRFSVQPSLNKTSSICSNKNDISLIKPCQVKDKIKANFNFKSFFKKKKSISFENSFSINQIKKPNIIFNYNSKFNNRKESKNPPLQSGNVVNESYDNISTKIKESIEKKGDKQSHTGKIAIQKIKSILPSSNHSPSKLIDHYKKQSVDYSLLVPSKSKKSTENRSENTKSINEKNVTKEELISYIYSYYKNNKEHFPTTTGFYRIGKLLGKGAFGKVNLGIHKLTEKMVAIKSIKKELLTNEESKRKIMQEFMILKLLNHNSVIKYKSIDYLKVSKVKNIYYSFLNYVVEVIY